MSIFAVKAEEDAAKVKSGEPMKEEIDNGPANEHEVETIRHRIIQPAQEIQESFDPLLRASMDSTNRYIFIFIIC